MDKYQIEFDYDGEKRTLGFSTKSERDKKVAELKTNRAVRSITLAEYVVGETWTAPVPEAAPEEV